MVDLSGLKFINEYHPEKLKPSAHVSKVSDKISDTDEKVSEIDTEDAGSFAKALAKELDSLSNRSELSNVLSDSNVMSSVMGLNDLSEMMASTNGRKAITAMAEQSLNGLIK